jgi:hypothetical protein
MANPIILDSQKAPYTVTGLDAAGQPAALQPGDAVIVVSSDPAATVVPDAAPATGTLQSGFIVGMSPKTGVVLTATFTPATGTAPPPVTDTVDIDGGEAATITFGLGAPVSK